VKLAIIADQRRKEKDLPIINEAKNFFDFLYVTIDQIRLEIEKDFTVKFNGEDLKEFDCLLPIPTLTHGELFYTVLRVLSDSVYIPFDPEKYLLASNKALLFNYLRNNGVDTRDFLIVTSKTPFEEIRKTISFPLIAQPSYKRVVVTNVNTLRDVISLAKIGFPVKLEKVIRPEKNIWAFLVDDFIACYEKTKKGSKNFKPSDELRAKALKVKELMGCEYCALNFLEHENRLILNGFTFSPDFSKFQNATKEDIVKTLLLKLSEKVKKRNEKKIWHKIVEVYKR